MDGNISHKLEPYRNYHNPITCLASLQPSLILSSHRRLSSARERKTFLSRECAFSSRIPRCIALRNLSFLYTWNEYNCIGISKRPTYVHLLHDPRTLDSLFKKLIEWLKFFFLFFFCKEDLIYEFRRLNFAKSKVLISINVLIFLSFSFCDHFKERLMRNFSSNSRKLKLMVDTLKQVCEKSVLKAAIVYKMDEKTTRGYWNREKNFTRRFPTFLWAMEQKYVFSKETILKRTPLIWKEICWCANFLNRVVFFLSNLSKVLKLKPFFEIF